MNKGLKLMRNIVKLAQEAGRVLSDDDEKQVAMEIKFAAECLLQGHEEPGHKKIHPQPD